MDNNSRNIITLLKSVWCMFMCCCWFFFSFTDCGVQIFIYNRILYAVCLCVPLICFYFVLIWFISCLLISATAESSQSKIETVQFWVVYRQTVRHFGIFLSIEAAMIWHYFNLAKIYCWRHLCHGNKHFSIYSFKLTTTHTFNSLLFISSGKPHKKNSSYLLILSNFFVITIYQYIYELTRYRISNLIEHFLIFIIIRYRKLTRPKFNKKYKSQFKFTRSIYTSATT